MVAVNDVDYHDKLTPEWVAMTKMRFITLVGGMRPDFYRVQSQYMVNRQVRPWPHFQAGYFSWSGWCSLAFIFQEAGF
jgi:hypothetical protein